MIKRRPGKREKKLWDQDFTEIRLKKSKNRAVIIYTVIFFCFSVIFVRLIDLMVLDHEMLSSRAEQQYRRVKILRPQRGIIRDRNMRQLAVNIETDSLYAVPSKVKDAGVLSSHLSPLIKVSARGLRRKISAKKNKDFMWLTRKMDEETFRKVKKLKNSKKFKELGFLTETKRYYPKNRIASHIIGHTDIDNEGLGGIELEYDSYLKGKTKKVQLGRDARGYSLFNDAKSNVRGNDLLLTIDEGIQYIVEREIDKAMETWKAEAVVAIMMVPDSGEILAMANRPTYDSNYAGRVRAGNRRNRAVTDVYEPGSTFKAILASAVLEEGIITTEEKFDVSKGYIKVPGGIIRDVHKNEELTFKQVIQKSSNVGAVQLGLKLGEDKFYSYIRRFGFGEKSGIDIPGEVRGILRSRGDWSGRSLASISIGQEIGVTALQLLNAYSTIANGGKLMKPYIVSEIISPSGEIIKSFSPQVKRKVISESTAKTITDFLKSVVQEGGTAQKASIKGNLIAGKTGTAQMIDSKTGKYSRHDYISSFIGFVPADDPEIALVVIVYKPRGEKYGGVVAAPVFRNIITNTLVYLNFPTERDENNILFVSKSR